MNTKETSSEKGKLYLVSTPIGNKDDITLRAINTIKRCDIVVCEEMKMGALALKNLNLAKEMIPLNENNESEMTFDVIDLIKSGKKVALISDAGTPVFADPGLYLVKQAIKNELDIEVVPGVSSIMTAIVRSGFELYEFLYAGFLPRRNEDRDRKLQKLAKERRTVIIFDTPYRLITLLEACSRIMPNRKAYIGMNMTMAFETHHYGTFTELFQKFQESKTKSEFVIVMEGDREWLENRHKLEQTDVDIDDTDEDDDEPVVYEYPVKAHQKNDDDARSSRSHKPNYGDRPFSPTAGGSRYRKDDRRDSRSSGSGGFKRDGDNRYKRDDRRDSRSGGEGGYKRDGRSGGYKRDDRRDSRSGGEGGFKRDGRSGGYNRDDRRDSRSGGEGGYKRDDRFKRDGAGERNYQSRDGEKSFGKDKTPKGAPRKFRKDNLEPSFGGKRKFSNLSKGKGKPVRKNRSSR